MDLELSAEDQRLLTSILTEHLGNLRMEIGDTDNRSWREDLKNDEERLGGILSRLGATVPSPGTPPSAKP